MALKNKEDNLGDMRKISESAYQQMKQQLEQGYRWYEIVRGFRAFYDHFRVAFPHLKQLPKYYSEDWAEQFKNMARVFVKSEDMTSVRKVLVGAGYGTDKWVEVAKREAEDIASAIDQLVEEAGIGEETEASASDTDEALEKARRVLGEDIWTKMLASPQDIKAMLVDEDEVIGDEETTEDEGFQTRLANAKKENHELQSTIEDKERRIHELEGQIRRLTESDDKEEKSEDKEEAIKEDEEDEEQIAQLQKRLDDLRKEHRDLQGEGKEKDDQIRTLNEQVKKLSATLAKDESLKSPMQKFSAPSSMGAQVREYEQQLAAKEHMISGLKGQLEHEQQAIEEVKEDVARERERRRKFEAELEEDRQGLREQMQQLQAVLSGASEMPSLEEFEEMESDELLEYIGDVEQEKQRALAGLDAMDAQEESYQKQLEVQQEEMTTIQDDLEKYKGTNLATEVEGAKTTIDTQRDQLETLLNISKNLKVQVAHLKERQDPLRNLVERLNLQEKALIRYIRINFDRGFMPSQAYEKGKEE